MLAFQLLLGHWTIWPHWLDFRPSPCHWAEQWLSLWVRLCFPGTSVLRPTACVRTGQRPSDGPTDRHTAVCHRPCRGMTSEWPWLL